MRINSLKSLTALAVFGLVLAMASPSFAQYRGRNYPRSNVDRLIRQAENRSNQFVAIFDRALDRSQLEGSIREDRLNERAMELERQLNVVRREFNQSRNYYDIRGNVENAISAAQGINTVMSRRQLPPRAERQWNLLRSDLNRLAAVFNVRQLR
jgi:hypothetical protein